MSARFHRLTVEAVEPITADAVRIVFAVPEPLRDDYRYAAGQHLTISFDGAMAATAAEAERQHQAPDSAAAGRSSRAEARLRRSYSLCAAPPVDGPPRRLAVAVKRHGPGGFADYAVSKLAPGEQLDVLTPVGGFHAQPDTGHQGPDRIVAIAAGSGITPILAIIEDALRANPSVTAALLYGNRTAGDVMFLDEIADLKDRYGARFEVLHVLSREEHGSALLTGRIDRVKLPRLLDAIGADPQDAYYLCGPFGMVDDARAVLGAQGARHVRFELFATSATAKESTDTGRAADTSGESGMPGRPETACPVDVNLAGRRTRCEVRPGDASLLDAILRERPDVPFACTDGVCGTCRARLLAGSVAMARDYALEPEEKSAGFILTCQSLPATADPIDLDFDA